MYSLNKLKVIGTHDCENSARFHSVATVVRAYGLVYIRYIALVAIGGHTCLCIHS